MNAVSLLAGLHSAGWPVETCSAAVVPVGVCSRVYWFLRPRGLRAVKNSIQGVGKERSCLLIFCTVEHAVVPYGSATCPPSTLAMAAFNLAVWKWEGCVQCDLALPGNGTEWHLVAHGACSAICAAWLLAKQCAVLDVSRPEHGAWG